MIKTLSERLSFDRDAELIRLVKLFQKGEAPLFYSGMKPHFQIAKQKPDRFRNHPPVLGVSLGGTNLKLMIASTEEGIMKVEHARSMHIPSEPTDFYTFFDDLLINDRQVKKYLERENETFIGFSFPMAIIDGVPYHPTKVPDLRGVIARSMNEVNEKLHFEKNLMNYLKSRGLPPAKLYYQSDGIIAHHGAVSLCDVRPDDSTTLIICGTGLASGDEENYIQMGIAPIIDSDEELYPAADTENHQYHYAVAGKGLFGLMDRCIRIKSRETGSRLGQFDLHEFFRDADGSKTAIQIWESALTGGVPEDDAAKIAQIVGEEAFSELQEIAALMIRRVIGSIANSVVATIVKMGPAENGYGHDVFFEGSIAVNRHILPRLKREIAELVGRTELYRELGVPQPFQPDMDKNLKPLASEEMNRSVLSDIDITLIGSVTAAMANDCL